MTNYLSNFHKCKITFDDNEFDSVDSVYKYLKEKDKYTESNMIMVTALKFLQNKELRSALLQEDIDKSNIPRSIKQRLMYIQDVFKEIEG
jgi:hypothetical protein